MKLSHVLIGVSAAAAGFIAAAQTGRKLLAVFRNPAPLPEPPPPCPAPPSRWRRIQRRRVQRSGSVPVIMGRCRIRTRGACPRAWPNVAIDPPRKVSAC